MLEILGVDIDDLDFEAMEELGITPEVLDQIAAMDPEELNLEILTDLGLDAEIAMGIMMGLSGGMNNTEGAGPELDISLNTEDGLYVELVGGYADNQGFAVTGELLLGSDIETVSQSASYTKDLAASVILTQKNIRLDSPIQIASRWLRGLYPVCRSSSRVSGSQYLRGK